MGVLLKLSWRLRVGGNSYKSHSAAERLFRPVACYEMGRLLGGFCIFH